MLEKDLAIYDYRKEKEKNNYGYIIDEKLKGNFDKFSVRTKEAGFVDCYIYRPIDYIYDHDLPIVINLHGGGFVLGYCEQDGIYCQSIADNCHCAVINIDYCLAPEFKYPSAIYSTYDVILEIKKRAEDMQLNPGKISILGHSAGASIACSLSLLDKELNKIDFTSMVLDYPIVDLEEFIVTKSHATERLTQYVEWYLTDLKKAKEPLASQINDDLSLLPETFMLSAEYDPLRKQEEEFVTKAVNAGSTVFYKMYENCHHGFTHKWFKEFNSEKSEMAWNDISTFFSRTFEKE